MCGELVEPSPAGQSEGGVRGAEAVLPALTARSYTGPPQGDIDLLADPAAVLPELLLTRQGRERAIPVFGFGQQGSRPVETCWKYNRDTHS